MYRLKESFLLQLAMYCQLLSPKNRSAGKSPDCQQLYMYISFAANIDTGLSADYLYFYNWVRNRCEGRSACDPVSIPNYWDLVGDTNNPATYLFSNGTKFTASCPQGGTKYVSGVYIHFECRGKHHDTVGQLTQLVRKSYLSRIVNSGSKLCTCTLATTLT